MQPITSLRHFAVDRSRVNKVVDVEFYQMDLASAVEGARKDQPDLFVDNGVYLPSWSKFAKDPIKAKGFWSRMLAAVFLGEGNADEMNVDLQFRKPGQKYVPQQRVAMMFLSIDNDELETVVQLTRDVLKGFRIIPIGGAFGIKNATAEQHTKQEIERATRAGENVLILSGGMAQRSYSIPEITELYLAYDGGEAGATIQKMSRALTSAHAGKIGRIVSLSFEPNRDDKFDQLLLTTAQNYKASHNIATLKEALKKVLATVDIFRCTKDGSEKFTLDTYLQQLMSANSLSRVIGKTCDLSILTQNAIAALAEGNADYARAVRTEATERGATFAPAEAQKRPPSEIQPDDFAKTLKKAREVVVSVAEHIDILVLGCGFDTIDETLAACDADVDLQKEVTKEYGVDYALIRFMFDHNVINRDLIELMFAA